MAFKKEDELTKQELTHTYFKDKEINITSTSVINVQLVSNTKQFSKVVVTGVGTATDKCSLAIFVGSITSDKLPMVSKTSIDQATVEKIARAQIFFSSGMEELL
jgi:TonB-dependent starch-binding outer membrane protein SusC